MVQNVSEFDLAAAPRRVGRRPAGDGINGEKVAMLIGQGAEDATQYKRWSDPQASRVLPDFYSPAMRGRSAAVRKRRPQS
jgi:hypothetical protein